MLFVFTLFLTKLANKNKVFLGLKLFIKCLKFMKNNPYLPSSLFTTGEFVNKYETFKILATKINRYSQSTVHKTLISENLDTTYLGFENVIFGIKQLACYFCG